MNRIAKLVELFSRFPGIGPRQAKRFVFFLLVQPKSFHNELSALINNIGDDVTRCKDCHRFFTSDQNSTCSICDDKNRDHETLMVIEKDVDLENIERSGVYNGIYFVLGGKVPILDSEPEKRVRINELKKYIDKKNFKEIVLATSANPDGENTSSFIANELKPISKEKKMKITLLGKGLSTGSELEYSDKETIKNAFNNRK